LIKIIVPNGPSCSLPGLVEARPTSRSPVTARIVRHAGIRELARHGGWLRQPVVQVAAIDTGPGLVNID
jgi:hypothetical protein